MTGAAPYPLIAQHPEHSLCVPEGLFQNLPEKVQSLNTDQESYQYCL